MFVTFFKKYNILIIAFIFFTGIIGTRPLIPLLASELGANAAQIGIIVALYPLLPFFLAIKVGQFVDRIGHKKPIVVSTLVGAVAILLPFIIQNIASILISQILAGIAHTVFAVSAQTFASSSKSHAERDSSIMTFSIGVALGAFLGPMFAGFLADHLNYQGAFGVLSAVIIVSTSIALFIDPTFTLNPDKKPQKLRKSLSLLKIKNLRLAFLISTIILLGKDVYTAYFPLLGVEFGLSDSTIGFIISLNALGGIIIRWLVPFMLTKMSRTYLIIGSIVSSGIFIVLLPLSESAVILGIVSFVIGLGAGIGQPMSISSTADALPQDRIGEGLGLRLTANRLTQISAPILFGAIAHIVSISGIFFLLGAVTILGGMKARIPD